MDKVSRKDFEAARDKWLSHIRAVLNCKFGEIAGFDAGHIVDIDIEPDTESRIVGIRMDNNFGIVDGESAVTFAKALTLAAETASKFEYLGYEVVDMSDAFSLDKVIRCCRTTANVNNSCVFRQIADWLTELKELRDE